jgi:hypothetical protein
VFGLREESDEERDRDSVQSAPIVLLVWSSGARILFPHKDLFHNAKQFEEEGGQNAVHNHDPDHRPETMEERTTPQRKDMPRLAKQ